MPVIESVGQNEVEYHKAAAVLREGVSDFSQTAFSKRKRKRGISNISQVDDETIGSKLDIGDLNAITGNSRLRNSLRRLVADTNIEPSSTSNPHQKLKAPTPHAIQARLNRQEAYSTTKQTLNKWLDAVKSTRNAEQLIFPLEGKAVRPLHSGVHSSYGQGDRTIGPPSRLESRISQALSLVPQVPKKDTSVDDSKDLIKSGGNRTRAKTAHLRMERELLLRKEAKAKRLRKIKSKSYRRLLKKDQKRLTKHNLDLEDACFDEAKEGGGGFQEGDRALFGEEGYDDESISNAGGETSSSRNDENLSTKRLFAMKFMEDAEKRASIRNQVLEASEKNPGPTGRRLFRESILVDQAKRTKTVPATKRKNGLPHNPPSVYPASLESSPLVENTNPWLCPPTSNTSEIETRPPTLSNPRADKGQRSAPIESINGHFSSTSPSPPLAGEIQYPMPSSLVLLVPDELSSDTPKNEQPGLLARAFAGDNILPETVKQKPKFSSIPDGGAPGGLPGWGSWGNSLGTSSKAHKQKKLSRTRQDVHQNRAERVNINQKLCKKETKYLATNLPYPFETGDQYERSLRFPIGQEWSTKQTHQALSAPKVIVKGGVVIAPLS